MRPAGWAVISAQAPRARDGKDYSMLMWCLEGYVDGSRIMRRVAIDRSPCRVGRHGPVDIALDGAGVSRNHAELTIEPDGLRVRDLGSTNGTFVNRHRIQEPTLLRAGDILHFAEDEFRVAIIEASKTPDAEQTRLGISELPERLPAGAAALQELLIRGAVTTLFQPIVSSDACVVAYEMLGRGAHPALPVAPAALFAIAESVGLETELSELFRRNAMLAAERQRSGARHFFNIHPREFDDLPGLLRRLEGLRNHHPQLDLVLEIHEAAIAGTRRMAELQAALRSLGMGLAFDDFGAGQSRLAEIAESPPDYVKLDMSLVRDFDTSPPARREMVSVLHSYLSGLGVRVIAEGVASAGEVAALQAIGIGWFQGYYFGEPTHFS